MTSSPLLSKSPDDGKPTLAIQVYEILRERILNGELEPGTNLVRRKISKELGVSPIPVTEALWRLEQDRLVESEPMYGSHVRRISLESIKDEQILREAIECQAARVCAEVATDEELRRLKEMARPVDEAEHSGNLNTKEGIRLHMDFHLSIAHYSGSHTLEKELERVGYRELVQLKWMTADRVPAPLHFHEELADAIGSRDPALAEQKMREHIRHGLQDLWQAMSTLSAVFPGLGRKTNGR